MQFSYLIEPEPCQADFKILCHYRLQSFLLLFVISFFPALHYHFNGEP